LRRWVAVDVTLKLLLVGALLYAATHTDVERFHDKAMGLRAVIYPVIALLPVAIWSAFFRRRIRYPYLIDIMVTLPFLLDIYGNVFGLYDSVTWFDDALHLINWVPWVCTFGLILRHWNLGRLNVAALTVGSVRPRIFSGRSASISPSSLATKQRCRACIATRSAISPCR
jgi:hypothetical protein